MRNSQKMLLSQVIAMTYGENNKDQPFKSIKGNNPCSIIQLKANELKNLGFLLALSKLEISISPSIAIETFLTISS